MRNQRAFALVIFAGLIIVCLGTFALGQTANDGKIANMTGGGSTVRWDLAVQSAGGVLNISAPDGRIFHKEFKAGTSPEINLSDRQFERLPDGQYTYDLRITPDLSAGAKEALKAGRAKDDDSEVERTARKHPSVPAMSQSGTFTILNGSVVVGGASEGQRVGKQMDQRSAPSALPGNAVTRLRNHRASLGAAPDQVIPDDLIVQGSACIGLDCVNNESFGFDTIRLKENNTRIKFEDTSTSAGFPSTDWQLTANDSAAGGSNKFSIEDITTARVPFTITGGAATNSIFVDSTGRLGLRTATPVLDIHAATSNTPAIRLEQNNSGGFTAQTWDVAGNEANFFVRDVTGGSRLPFRIRPGAPTSSIDINASGDVGIGTASPSQMLHLSRSTTGNQIALNANSSNNASATSQWRLSNDAGNATAFVQYSSTAAGVAYDTANNSALSSTAGDLNLITVGAKPIRFWTNNTTEVVRILSSGNVGIGTTAPDLKLSVSGDADKSVGGGSWQFFSDERLKNIKGRFNPGLKAVMQLQPIRFAYKRDNPLGLQSEIEQVGFGAQALQKVIPEAVSKNANGYLMVNNDPILWTMLNAIKEQQKEIAELKGQVQKLRAASHRRRK